LELLVRATEDFASSLEIGQTLRHVVQQMASYLDAEASSLFLVEDEDTLVCRACAGPIDITGLHVPLSEGIVGRTVRDRTAYLVRDVRIDPDFARRVDRSTGFVTRSILSAPLCTVDGCVGALEVVNARGRDGLFDEQDRQVLSALATLAALAIRNAHMAEALVGQERLQRELELAREIQRSLLPGRLEEGGPIAGVSVPAREVSGDFFDYFPTADGRLAFCIGDVAGKGMDAALLMAKTSSLLRCLGKHLESPGELLAQVNNELLETSTRGKFVTAIAGWVNPRTGEVLMSNAGHPPPLLRSREGHYRALTEAGPPLGVLSPLQAPETRVLLSGESLYLFTDGATEAMDAAGAVLGTDGLERAISTVAERALQARVEEVAGDICQRSARRRDDITLLVVEGPLHPESA
jgi:phosphoserine phosphatase RsbU/P